MWLYVDVIQLLRSAHKSQDSSTRAVAAALLHSLLIRFGHDVERFNKGHKAVLTKIRARLSNSVTRMLLHTYMNLCLLNKCSEPMEEFLLQAIGPDDGEDGDGDESIGGGGSVGNGDGDGDGGGDGDGDADGDGNGLDFFMF